MFGHGWLAPSEENKEKLKGVPVKGLDDEYLDFMRDYGWSWEPLPGKFKGYMDDSSFFEGLDDE